MLQKKPSETYKFLSNYISNYYRLGYNIPNMFNDVVVKSFEHPDKVSKFLSKNINKTHYDNDINFSNGGKKSGTKKAYYTQNTSNYYIDTVNITYQFPTTEKSNDRFNKTPNDDVTEEETTEKSVYTILHFLDIVFKLITLISILPDTVKGSEMIYNVLNNLLDYLQ